ncbi:hypothetical protein [Brevibacillus sp. NRRL NRS-603]|uniref:hypothetical protein n=1 Tax=Brevibacillus sp. NRRL NRS-603 TaxID=2126351 RepID=UPI003517C9ED
MKGIEHFGSTAIDGMTARPIIEEAVRYGEFKKQMCKKGHKHCWTIPIRKMNSSARCWRGRKRGIKQIHKKRAGRRAALLFFFLSSND